MIVAAQGFAFDHAVAERHLPVRAAILKPIKLAAFGAHQGNRFAREMHAERLARFRFRAPGDGIPVIGMRADAAQVGRRS